MLALALVACYAASAGALAPVSRRVAVGGLGAAAALSLAPGAGRAVDADEVLVAAKRASRTACPRTRSAATRRCT